MITPVTWYKCPWLNLHHSYSYSNIPSIFLAGGLVLNSAAILRERVFSRISTTIPDFPLLNPIDTAYLTSFIATPCVPARKCIVSVYSVSFIATSCVPAGKFFVSDEDAIGNENGRVNEDDDWNGIWRDGWKKCPGLNELNSTIKLNWTALSNWTELNWTEQFNWTELNWTMQLNWTGLNNSTELNWTEKTNWTELNWIIKLNWTELDN